jgi:DNA-binding MarR family transcriptional regulator
MTQTETPATTREPITQLLSQAERTVARRIEHAIRSWDVSLEHWRVLSLLSDGSGHAMTEIARYAMVPAPTLTKIIDRLVEKNLVYRRVDDADRRRVLVFLASRGRDLHRRLAAKVAEEEAALAGMLGEAEVERLGELLTRLARPLD